MEFKKFKNGKNFTIGVELELRILDKLDLSLKNEFDNLISEISPKYKKNLAKEFLDSIVEINTPVFFKEKDVINYLKEILKELKFVADKKGFLLQSSGSYAQKNKKVKINKDKRYKKIYDEHRVLLDDFTICGTHIHIGFENFDKALNAYNYCLYYLPLLTALSASSSFYDNKNTGIHSYRTKIFDRLPKASIPDYFNSYEDMKNTYDFLANAGIINSIKDIWWDIRIQPSLKTIEFRVCDAINDFDRLEVLLLLTKTMCKLSFSNELIKLPMQVLKQNMWSATRYSMDAKILNQNGDLINISKEIINLARKGYKKGFLCQNDLKKIEKFANRKSISQEMIELYKKTENIKDIDRLGVI